jgi:phage baseplate assembly protein W
MSVDFLGAGWNFPLQIGPTNAIALATQVRDIEQAIEIIIRTSPGERPMRPEFGCRIQDHLFSPVNEATASAIAFDVRRALELWEPRIDIESVKVTAENQDQGTFYIDVGYQVRGYNDTRNLVFPFYAIPDESNALTTNNQPPMALPSNVRASGSPMLNGA